MSKSKFWTKDMKIFFIVSAIILVVVILAGIFFWEWDGIYYFLGGCLVVEVVYAHILNLKLEYDYLIGKGRH